MDQRAQISVEFVLFAGIVLLVVLAFATVVADQSEMNSIATAVRLGAENSTTQMSLLNSTMQPSRVTGVSMSGVNGTKDINIVVNFSSPISSTAQTQVLTSINNSLTAQGYTTAYAGGSPLSLATSRHNYTVSLS